MWAMYLVKCNKKNSDVIESILPLLTSELPQISIDIFNKNLLRY